MRLGVLMPLVDVGGYPKVVRDFAQAGEQFFQQFGRQGERVAA